MSRFNGNYIENPAAYADAIQRRIKANANVGRRRKLEAAVANDAPEFRAWLFGTLPAELEALRAASQHGFDADDAGTAAREAYRAYEAAFKTWRKRVGNLPEFLVESMDNWGGLTDGQLAFARKAFAQNIERAEGRDAQDAARRATAAPWTAGRQYVEGVVQSARWHFADIGYGRSSSSLKGLLLLDDGRKLWTSIPTALHPEGDDSRDVPAAIKGQRLAFTVTVAPSDDDATMGFGSRPTDSKPKTPKAKAS